jgi:glycosyltransferase involved in cell wall biosynthesis
MRIRFLSPKSYTVAHPELPPDFGGAEVQMYLLAREMSKNSQDTVELWVADYGQNRLEQDGELWLRNAFPGPALSAIVRFGRLVRLFLEFVFRRADVVIQRTLTPWTWFLALLTRLKGAKFVYMVADDSELSVSRGSHNEEVGDPTGARQRYRSFGLCHLVVTQNKHQTDSATKRYHTDLLELHSSIAATERADLLPDGRYVLWVGRNVPKKRPLLFIHLAERLPHYDFVMVCRAGPSGAENQQLQAEAAEVPNLRLTWGVPYAQINEWFRHARIFVNTSSSEGFPNAFLQAARGGAVIVSLFVDPGGVLSAKGIGAVCEDELERLVSATESLMVDEDRYREYVERAWSYLLEHHDASRNAARFHAELSRLVGQETA